MITWKQEMTKTANEGIIQPLKGKAMQPLPWPPKVLRLALIALLAALGVLNTMCVAPPAQPTPTREPTVSPTTTPTPISTATPAPPLYLDASAAIAARVADLLARMTLDEKTV